MLHPSLCIARSDTIFQVPHCGAAWCTWFAGPTTVLRSQTQHVRSSSSPSQTISHYCMCINNGRTTVTGEAQLLAHGHSCVQFASLGKGLCSLCMSEEALFSCGLCSAGMNGQVHAVKRIIRNVSFLFSIAMISMHQHMTCLTSCVGQGRKNQLHLR